jgi:putative transcriptional regulator
MESLRGQILIAAPGLLDPNFRRTVVLVADHGEEGAMGLVLNRPSAVAVSDAAPELEPLVGPGALLSSGGPVQPTTVVILAEFDDPARAGMTVLEDIGFVAPGEDLEDLAAIIRRARVLVGYAGWAAGQLEAELEREDWLLEPARGEDVFGADPEDLWGRVLRRKGGSFALLARMPLDPSLN